jgi:hypothetical protein
LAPAPVVMVKTTTTVADLTDLNLQAIERS